MRLGTWGIVPIWILIALPPDQRQVPAFDCCTNSCGQKVQQRKVIWMNEFKKVTKPTVLFAYYISLSQSTLKEKLNVLNVIFLLKDLVPESFAGSIF